MQTIWKQTLEIQSSQTIAIPRGSNYLSVQMQFRKPQIWFTCDPQEGKTIRTIRIIGTGHQISDNELGNFIGTIQVDSGHLVLHVFEGLP